MAFLKWIGGKSQVLHIFKDYFPDFYSVNGYIEPFVGGGNVYFYIAETYGNALQGKPIYISDINRELINCYIIVRDKVDDLIIALEEHQKLHSEKHYFEVREEYPPGQNMDNVEKAAAFIYLSRACFGGLWRVNSRGKMNADFGGNLNLKVVDEDLHHYSKLLQNAKIYRMSFENILKIKNIEGYMIYLDPPYYDTGQDNFAGYSKDGYHLSKRMLLPKVFEELDKRGCKVMMSNSNSPAIRNMFSNFNIHVIQTNRHTGIQLSSITKEKLNDANRLTEVIVTNYKIPKKQKTIDDAWT